MKDNPSYTPEEAAEMGYNPDVINFFKERAPDLLEYMWGNDSSHYTSILKNEIDIEDLIRTAQTQLTFKGPIGYRRLSSLVMAEFRLTHPQTKENLNRTE